MVVAALPALARQRLGDLLGQFLSGGDRLHVGAELALQHVTHQRVVRAAEHDDVDAGVAQRRARLLHELERALGVRLAALDRFGQTRARDLRYLDAGVEVVDRLDVALAVDGRLGGEDADLADARGLDRSVRLGRDHAEHGDGRLALQHG